MTNPDHPLPTSGGSYMRNLDGSLTRINEEGEPINDAGQRIDADGNVIDVVAEQPAQAETAPADPVQPEPSPPKSGKASRATGAALTEKEV